jgi:hypothetical protein
MFFSAFALAGSIVFFIKLNYFIQYYVDCQPALNRVFQVNKV